MVGRILLCFFILMIVSYNEGLDQLIPGGVNVCSRRISHSVYVAQTFERVGYDSYRTCCKFFMWCWEHCTEYRTKTVFYTNSVLQTRYRNTYFCCSGWARLNGECPKPICNAGCKNGKCLYPNICTCNPGYEGMLCENDINECLLNPCSQVCTNLHGRYVCGCNKGYQKVDTNPKNPSCKDVDECTTSPCKCALNTVGCQATCSNTKGSYLCSCNKGFQLSFDSKTCIEIDECSSRSLNQCEQICHNRPGKSHVCSCIKGYLLNKDGKTCTEINECDTLNGGCSHICVNIPGTYECLCRSGFRLTDNKKTCEDIDECSGKIVPCDNQYGTCTNIPGSYSCGCKKGFKMKNDTVACFDIDECKSSSTNGCSQNCHNNVGSYTCSCRNGYRLNKNERTCDDVDECTENLDKCDHNCHNNVGSYTCSCRLGHKFDTDGKTCVAFPCETISKPLNGQLVCSGYVTDEQCNFTCNDGFYLVGSPTRICLPSTTWSGHAAECKRQPCPTLNPPKDGSLLIPCIELFGSSCLAKCNKGFYLIGSSSSECVVQNGNTTWLPNNATCKASLPCHPNPCQHGGKCTEVSGNNFSCDCTETSYTGIKCTTGIVTMPSIPQLQLNQTSQFLKVFARPDYMLEVWPIYDDRSLDFNPSKLVIYPSKSEVEFTVTALGTGVFKVQWKLVGINAFNFNTPKESTIYVFNKTSTDKAVDITPGFYTRNCKE